MRFPDAEVNRKNVERKKLYYWIRKEGIIIVDYGYPYGDIHIYKHIKSMNSRNLKEVLEEYLANEDLMIESSLEIKELTEANELKSDIFTYHRNIED